MALRDSGRQPARLAWSVELIASENVTFRTASDHTQFDMPFDPLLFFADARNGDQFAFVLPEWRT